MDKDFKIIIAAIILILAIAFAASNYNITGRVTGSDTLVRVTPAVVNAGELINIEVTPGNLGVHKTYYICRDEFLCHANAGMHCGSFKCSKPLTASYKTWSSWDGVYYIKIFDYGKNEFVKSYFTVINE